MTEAVRTDGSLVIVGNPSEEHVGAHLLRAAGRLGIPAEFIDQGAASGESRLLRSLSWRLRGHLPPFPGRVEGEVLRRVAAPGVRWLVVTGISVPRRRTLEAVRALGVTTVNYLTDDPWNRAHTAPWFLEALPAYDRVATTRTAALPDLEALGCRLVSHVPFGYCPEVHFPCGDEDAKEEIDVLVAGGADADRVPLVRALLGAGFSLSLLGGYWARYPEFRASARGLVPLQVIREETARCRVTIGLVRRANRDGSAMRSFEAAAMGACLVIDDTWEHRALFGPDGESVLYFRDAAGLVAAVRALLGEPARRREMRRRVRETARGGGHTYGDRLRAMLCPT